MSKYTMIGTWKMALDGFDVAKSMLNENSTLENAIKVAVSAVEDNPANTSVGYGALPNENGEIELDAAYMNGNSLQVGAFAGAKNIKNPIELAIDLSKQKFNSFLVGTGAENYAKSIGLEQRMMLNDNALQKYENKLIDIQEKGLSPYEGHDTVCIVGKKNDEISVGVSTSGLFMKKQGRVGDAPISGSGFYANSDYGSAAATGLGEDIMKTCISYEIVQKMKGGLHAMEACETAVLEASKMLEKKNKACGDISVVAIDKDGNYGAATNIDEFPYVVFNQDMDPKVLIVTDIRKINK
ncbi:MAG: isoaspartyl peptidase/L-asparaginase [Mycoplasmatales bacterium]